MHLRPRCHRRRLFPALLLISFCVAALLPVRLFSQTVDSLKHVLNDPELSTASKIETLYLLSRELTYVDNLKSLEYAEAALALAAETGDRQGMAYAYRILGSIYAINGNYFTSMQYIHRALDIFRDDHDETGIANCYISLGHVYRMLHNRELEVEYHKKSFELFSKTGTTERIGVSAHNLGESYYNAGDYAMADSLTTLAIQINDSIGNGPVLSNCYKVKGLLEGSRGDQQAARVYFEKVLEISRSLGENAQKVASAESLLRLADISRNTGNPSEELSYLHRAVNLCRKFNLDMYLSEVYHKLALFHARAQNLELTQDYIELEKTQWEAMQEAQLQDRAQLTAGMLNIDRLSKQAADLEERNRDQERSLATRNQTLILIGVCLLIVSLILYKFLKMNRRLRSKNGIIERQREELAALNTTKDKFFSIVAHDIRSPLDALKSFSTLLLEHYDNMSRDEVQEMAAHLDRSVDNTLQLANNLIVWAKGQMHEIRTEPKAFNLRPVLGNIYSVFHEIARQKQIELEISCPKDAVVWGDQEQIEFIIRNLVNNAIKYTQPEGAVRVNVRPSGEEGIEVTISDNGIGMEQPLVEQLFSLRTERSRQGTAGETGSGLGLALSHEFLRLNNATIRVESRVNEGTSFTLNFKGHKAAA